MLASSNVYCSCFNRLGPVHGTQLAIRSSTLRHWEEQKINHTLLTVPITSWGSLVWAVANIYRCKAQEQLGDTRLGLKAVPERVLIVLNFYLSILPIATVILLYLSGR